MAQHMRHIEAKGILHVSWPGLFRDNEQNSLYNIKKIRITGHHLFLISTEVAFQFSKDRFHWKAYLILLDAAKSQHF